MKKTISLALRRVPGRINAELFADNTDNPVDLIEKLNDLYPNLNEGMVRIKVIADDGIDIIPFEEILAKEIILGTKEGKFVTTQNKAAKLLSSELEGEYPFLGILNGEAHQWSVSGKSFKDAKDDLSIIIHSENK